MRKCIFVALAVVVVVMAVGSAGCLDNLRLAPSEVQNHGNIIAIDSQYIQPSTIFDLLLNPSVYQPGLFQAIDKHLPRNNPVVEVGVGLGVAMADVSQKLNAPKMHVAVTPNPYMIPLLEMTCEMNSLPVVIEQKAVTYGVGEGTEVPFSVSKNLQMNVVSIDETDETIMVPATTVSELISESAFANSKNISLIVETPDLIQEIFDYEPHLHDQVSTIIAVTSASTNLEVAKLLNKALKVGYSPLMISDKDLSGQITLVFKR